MCKGLSGVGMKTRLKLNPLVTEGEKFLGGWRPEGVCGLDLCSQAGALPLDLSEKLPYS